MDEIKTLAEMFHYVCQKGPTYRQHVEAVRILAQQCSTIAELGVYEMNSGFGILYGLSENPSSQRSFLAIDSTPPPKHILEMAQKWSKEAEIDFRFQQADDMEIHLDPVDFLHIDTNHTYRHLTFELETFSSVVRSYIALHDTSPPWGYVDQNEESHPLSDSKYPAHIDRKKRGVWPAVVDFLEKHPEWQIFYRKTASPGITVIKRNDAKIS